MTSLLRQDCGGCRGLGSHHRWCQKVVGLSAAVYGQMSQQLGSMADTVGANNPGLANQLYSAAAEMEEWAHVLKEQYEQSSRNG